MGIFKSEEEKQQKREENMRAVLAKYELTSLSPEYANAVKNINYELAGSGLSEFGNLLAPSAETAARMQTQFLNAAVQQNWIIIRQLDEISKKLDKINR